MSHLYLSYAGLAYCVKKYLYKDGYKLSKQGKGYLSLWHREQSPLYFQVDIDEGKPDCGYVYTASEDFIQLFREKGKNEYIEFLKRLMTDCVRPYIKKPPHHCRIGDSPLKNKIETDVEGGGIVNCLKGTIPVNAGLS